jgi:hypothetical protein
MIILGDYIGPGIRAVKDMDYVGTPTVGYVVETDKGWYAITARDECEFVGPISSAVAFVGKKWRARK